MVSKSIISTNGFRMIGMFQPTCLMGRRVVVALDGQTIEGVVVSIGPRITIIDKGRAQQISLRDIASIAAAEPCQSRREVSHWIPASSRT